MSESTLGIALLGHGVIGSGVAKILTEQRLLLRQRTGLDLDLRHVAELDKQKYTTPGLPYTTDAAAAIDDPRTQLVIELIGGTGVAGQFVERALRLGKPVVTANKSLLATKGPELFALARKHGTCIAFEASCGGGIPIIQALTRGLAANRIDALLGIVNGTCNFILTRMTRNGWSYDQALSEAQKAGLAEANPAMDISGRDSAQKLAILAGLAFNVRVAEGDIHLEGIDTLQKEDLAAAKELGYVIKLLAIAERQWPAGQPHDCEPPADGNAGKSSLILRVHPTLVHKDDVLAEVSDSFNAISVFGHVLGHGLFYGRGAGKLPTASAVVSDVIGVGLGTTLAEFQHMRVFPDVTPRARVIPISELRSRYYLRLMAKDAPGVLAQVTDALGRHGISLSAILQRESDAGQVVPVVITTHLANEGNMQAALKAIDALPTVGAKTVCLRIIDQPREFATA